MRDEFRWGVQDLLGFPTEVGEWQSRKPPNSLSGTQTNRRHHNTFSAVKEPGSHVAGRITGWNVAEGAFARDQFVECRVNPAHRPVASRRFARSRRLNRERYCGRVHSSVTQPREADLTDLMYL